MNSKLLFLSLIAALDIFSSTPDLWACDIKATQEAIQRPTISAWSAYYHTLDDQIHKIKAQSMTWQDQKKTAEFFAGTSHVFCIHYYSALINNPNAPSMICDQAIIELIPTAPALKDVKEQCRKKIWKESRNCLLFMVNNEKTYSPQKNLAFMQLAVLHSPLVGSFYPNPELTEKYLLEALSGECTPLQRASMLNELALLYNTRYLGNDQEGLETAYTYYHKIIKNESLPLEMRCEAKIGMSRLLARYRNHQEKQEKRQKLLKSVQDQDGAGPNLKKRAHLYAATLMQEDITYSGNAKQENYVKVGTQLCSLRSDPSGLDTDDIYLLNQAYALSLVGLHHECHFDFQQLKVEQTELDKILKELIHPTTPPQKDMWATSVILAANIMYITDRKRLPYLNNQQMGEFLDTISTHKNVEPRQQNLAKGMKTLLVGKGLLPQGTQDILKDLQDTLQDISLPNHIKIKILEALGRKTHELYPHYNKNIESTIEYLRNALKEEIDPDYQARIKFLLYIFFRTYKECTLTAQEMVPLVQDLSSQKTPEALRIKIITDDDSDEASPNMESNPPLEKKKDADFKSETDEASELQKELESYETTSRKAIKILPQPTALIETETPTLNPKLERDIKKAELLLEDLKSTHGTADQREAQNMFRRLGFCFNPTATEGLTIHLGHKSRNNKKGTPGRLDGGRKADLAPVLEKAIQEAKNPQPQIDVVQESSVKQPQNSQKSKIKQTKSNKNKKRGKR